eukprot:COSAG06_NODE_2245_length_7263_cov_19.964964_7_plen_168_part_00
MCVWRQQQQQQQQQEAGGKVGGWAAAPGGCCIAMGERGGRQQRTKWNQGACMHSPQSAMLAVRFASHSELPPGSRRCAVTSPTTISVQLVAIFVRSGRAASRASYRPHKLVSRARAPAAAAICDRCTPGSASSRRQSVSRRRGRHSYIWGPPAGGRRRQPPCSIAKY